MQEFVLAKQDQKLIRTSLANRPESALLQFIFACHKQCSIFEEDVIRLMFESAQGSKVFEHLDRSHEFFDIF